MQELCNKILSVYFWGGNVFTLGEIRFTLYFGGNNVYFGEITFTFGYSRRLRVFGISFLLLKGFGDSVGRGGPVGVFEKI